MIKNDRVDRGLSVFLVLAVSSCQATDRLEVRFDSEATQKIVQRIQTFIFSDPDVSCLTIDPRGLGPGDAPTRSGRTPAFAAEAKRDDEVVAEFEDVPTGRATIVVEAWGLPCVEVGGSADDPVCTRLAPDGDPILRGYYCNDLNLSRATRVDLVADMTSFAQVGAQISVPTNFPANAVRYDEEAPLFVADGLPARDIFMVQVLNHLAEADNDVKVRFEVVEGSGSFSDPQPLLTALDETIQDEGLAATRLLTGVDASSSGRIVVSAHAPGYEGSPIRFVAQAVPSVTVETERVPIPTTLVDLSETDPSNHPVVMEDLDGDGRVDLATVAGGFDHRLLLAFQTEAGWSLHASEQMQGQVRTMAMATLAPGRRRLLLSLSDPTAFGPTPAGQTAIIQNPRFAAIDVSARPATETFSAAPTILPLEDGQPITKATVSMEARDIDGDGVDELALSRCSYIFRTNLPQFSDVECNARLSDHTDSELALLRVEGGDTLTVSAALQSEGNDGGFRGVRLVDIDGDGSLDLASAASSIAVGVCGSARMPQSGFGFNDAPRFFTTITFGQGWSLDSGRFNDDPYADLLVTGAVRSASPDAGLKLVPGGECDFFDGPNPIIVGPKTNARDLVVRTADLNGDGWSDGVLLHRQVRELQIYLGGGRHGLAAGPTIRLPFSTTSEMDLALEGDTTRVGLVAPADNALLVARISRR